MTVKIFFKKMQKKLKIISGRYFYVAKLQQNFDE